MRSLNEFVHASKGVQSWSVTVLSYQQSMLKCTNPSFFSENWIGGAHPALAGLIIFTVIIWLIPAVGDFLPVGASGIEQYDMSYVKVN